jgi:thymidylate kinase
MISISGIDGCGKGTQIELVEHYLRKNNISYMKRWARGSWTPGIELVKKIVRSDHGFTEEQKDVYRTEARSNPKSARIILILSILDMIWYFGIWYRILKLFAKEFICDRYLWDTLVDFRVNFSNFDFEKWSIWKLLIWLTPQPDVSILLVISAEMSVERGIKKNEFFMEPFEVKAKKVNEYHKLMLQKKWNCIISADDVVENIFERIKTELKR